MKDWLKNNFSYLLGFLIGLIWAIVTVYLFYMIAHFPQADFTAITALYATVSTTFGVVVNYHFGSSSGSAKKTEIIEAQSKIQ